MQLKTIMVVLIPKLDRNRASRCAVKEIRDSVAGVRIWNTDKESTLSLFANVSTRVELRKLTAMSREATDESADHSSQTRGNSTTSTSRTRKVHRINR